jgi:hypothetical protein
MAIRNPLVLKNGITTELQSGDFLPLSAINGLGNDLDAIIKTIANISTANGFFELDNPTQVELSSQQLNIVATTQSTNSEIFEIDSDNNLLKINRNLPISILSTISVDVVGEGTLTVSYSDIDSGEILSSFSKTITQDSFSFSESSLIEIDRFLTPTYSCNIVITITSTFESCLVNKFSGVVLVSGGSGKIVTTNPIQIIGNVANIGYPINGGIVYNTAMVFLDLTPLDFDIYGKLLNNRNYLIEEHYGIKVEGSNILFGVDLNGKYVVVSHVQ